MLREEEGRHTRQEPRAKLREASVSSNSGVPGNSPERRHPFLDADVEIFAGLDSSAISPTEASARREELQDRPPARVCRDAAGDRPVDLDPPGRQTGAIAKRSVAGGDVVERDGHAQIVRNGERRLQHLQRLHSLDRD
jgi:hypothetical protein